jgi:hypothetical protein
VVVIKKYNRISSVVSSIRREFHATIISTLVDINTFVPGKLSSPEGAFRSKNRAGEVQARTETQEKSSLPEVHLCRFSLPICLLH